MSTDNTTPLPAESLHDTTQPTAPTAPADAAPVPPAKPTKLRPRTGPIVWGSLILVFCAYVLVRESGGHIDTTAWIISSVIGLGVLLLTVGIVLLVRGPRNTP